MSRSAIVVVVVSPLRFIVLLCALFAVVSVDAAPLKYRRSHRDVDELAARSVTEPAPRERDVGPSLPTFISRALTRHLREILPIKRATDDLLSSLFPVDGAKEKWTTAGGSGSIALSDSTLHIVAGSGPKYTYVEFEGKKALKAHFDKGSYRLGVSGVPEGGVSFYASGPSSVDLTTAKEATFGYSVYFPEGFEWVKGGKLPGFYGGDDDKVSLSCSGGRRDTRCFSARLMWRPEGAGEMYTYLPPYDVSGFEANKKQCSVPNSDCNPTYGTSLNRGSFHFKAGGWTTVSERVRLNTPGKADGELELFVEGKSVVKVEGLIIRDSAKGKIRGIQMQTFFGGHDKDWATPKDQDIYFADLSVSITETE